MKDTASSLFKNQQYISKKNHILFKDFLKSVS